MSTTTSTLRPAANPYAAQLDALANARKNTSNEQWLGPSEKAIKALAKRLGITEAAIKRDQMSGNTLAEIAAKHGVSRSEAVAVVGYAISGAAGKTADTSSVVAAEILVGPNRKTGKNTVEVALVPVKSDESKNPDRTPAGKNADQAPDLSEHAAWQLTKRLGKKH